MWTHPTHDPMVIHATWRRMAGFGLESHSSVMWGGAGDAKPLRGQLADRSETFPASGGHWDGLNHRPRVPIKKFRKSGAIVGKLGD